MDTAGGGVRIGPYRLSAPVLLAPMAGVTDRPFRQLCRRYGAGLAAAEMVSADARLWQTDKSLRRTDHRGEAQPRVAQLVGADPAMLAAAARYNVARGAQIIDLNFGCPAKKVCRQAAGSALLADEPLIARLCAAVVAAVEVPVTIKIRTGPAPAQRNAVRIAQLAEAAGVAAIAVHGRTRACAYSGPVEYDSIRAVKQAVRIPVIANGDIGSPEQAQAVLAATGADAIMIGRAAQGRPWLFRQIGRFLATGERVPDPEPAAVADLLAEHLSALYGFYGAATGVRVARKHIGWYGAGRAVPEALRNALLHTEDVQMQQRLARQMIEVIGTAA